MYFLSILDLDDRTEREVEAEEFREEEEKRGRRGKVLEQLLRWL